MLMEYNRTQTGDSAEWLEEKQELEILFQFLFQIDKIFRVKKVCDADIQTITYFLDRNKLSWQDCIQLYFESYPDTVPGRFKSSLFTG